MQIGGLLKFSMIDFPGRVSAVVFTQGCNLNCGYCHNYELITLEPLLNAYDEQYVMDFLRKRRGVLDGVVITGGEPTLQPDLIRFAAKVKEMGYLLKLDTNGTHPSVLEELFRLNLVNFVAMDIKATFNKYQAVCRCHVDLNKIKRSIDILTNSAVEHEFRTTFDTSILTLQDIEDIKKMLPIPLKVQECLVNAEKKPVLKIESY
jgi:pyruvate formate lyase activating enzyme